jgi:hypothetical protein
VNENFRRTHLRLDFVHGIDKLLEIGDITDIAFGDSSSSSRSRLRANMAMA